MVYGNISWTTWIVVFPPSLHVSSRIIPWKGTLEGVWRCLDGEKIWFDFPRFKSWGDGTSLKFKPFILFFEEGCITTKITIQGCTNQIAGHSKWPSVGIRPPKFFTIHFGYTTNKITQNQPQNHLQIFSRVYTIPETNIFAPENGWLEDEFPFGKAYF